MASNHRIRRVGPDGIITTVAGTGEQDCDGDGKQATATMLKEPMGVAVAQDGSLFIAEFGCNRIRHVSPDGIVSTFAGTGVTASQGDGGPAKAAAIWQPGAVAVGPDGSVFILEEYARKVRRVGTDGIVTTVAGGGSSTAEGVPATTAQFIDPRSIAVGPDGSLYIGDISFVRRVGLDGTITTIAGNGMIGCTGDGGPATAAALYIASGLAVAADGSLFIAAVGGNVVRRIGPDGVISTVAGACGSGSIGGDGGSATAAHLNEPLGIALGSDRLYIADGNNDRIRVAYPVLPDMTTGDFTVASDDGTEVYAFDRLGRHLKTLDALTGATRYVFGYDPSGYLASITDAAGKVTTIERTGATATAIVAPFGERTALAVNPDNGMLKDVTDSMGGKRSMDYYPGGLLQHFTDPRGYVHTFTYDPVGLLMKDENPAGGSTTLTRVEQSKGYSVTTTSKLGRAHTYQVEALSTGGTRRTTTAADGTKTVTTRRTDESEQTSMPDGSTVTVQKGPDPRWGMVAPIARSVVTTTPKHTRTVTTARTVVLSKPGDPWSMTNLTDTVSVNAKTWSSVYDGTLGQVTRTSPEKRTSVTTLDDKGRVKGISVTGLEPVTVTYDDKGRPWTVTQGERQTTFGYDAQGYLK